MHCQGIPVTGPNRRVSPLCDLKGNGGVQLALVVLKTGIKSASGVVDAFVSGSVDWDLTIRDFKGAAFSRSPDKTIVITTVASTTDLPADRIRIEGDANGDGRPDILTRRSDTRWDLLLSSTNGDWFVTRPAATFEIPFLAVFEHKDLNGDGLSDLIVRAMGQPRLLIFLSQPAPGERKNP
jgi:hypothetical protein